MATGIIVPLAEVTVVGPQIAQVDAPLARSFERRVVWAVGGVAVARSAPVVAGPPDEEDTDAVAGVRARESLAGRVTGPVTVTAKSDASPRAHA